MSAEELCDLMIEQFTTMTFDGLTGEGMTWDATGAVFQEPEGHGNQRRRLCRPRLICPSLFIF